MTQPGFNPNVYVYMCIQTTSQFFAKETFEGDYFVIWLWKLQKLHPLKIYMYMAAGYHYPSGLCVCIIVYIG